MAVRPLNDLKRGVINDRESSNTTSDRKQREDTAIDNGSLVVFEAEYCDRWYYQNAVDQHIYHWRVPGIDIVGFGNGVVIRRLWSACLAIFARVLRLIFDRMTRFDGAFSSSYYWQGHRRFEYRMRLRVFSLVDPLSLAACVIIWKRNHFVESQLCGFNFYLLWLHNNENWWALFDPIKANINWLARRKSLLMIMCRRHDC